MISKASIAFCTVSVLIVLATGCIPESPAKSTSDLSQPDTTLSGVNTPNNASNKLSVPSIQPPLLEDSFLSESSLSSISNAQVVTDDKWIDKPVEKATSKDLSRATTSPIERTSTSPLAVGPASTPLTVSKISELDPNKVIEAHEQVLTKLYTITLPSVAKIEVDHAVQDSFIPIGEGSGFVWDEHGTVITNNHVVKHADRVWVRFEDGSVFRARVLGTDPDSDLAALHIDTPTGYLTSLSQGDSDQLQVGQIVVTMGNPFGQGFTMTRGIISALGRTIPGDDTSPYKIPSAIQTDAPINPGNSGGPLFDRKGNVIGINSQIISQSGSSSGVGFAIPINIAKIVIPSLIRDGSYTYAYMGISGRSVDSRFAETIDLHRDIRGVMIQEIIGKPAASAGLAGTTDKKRGDIITAIDSEVVKTMEDLVSYLVQNTTPGDKVVVDVIRLDDSTASIEVLLEPRPI